jgi:serine carboxypeptidase 1
LCPVGTGFSYIENKTLAVTSDEEAAKDLLTFLKRFLETNRAVQNNSLFIVGESYGGKHASILGLSLSKAIASGYIKLNLGGVVLADSWISPVDYVLSWGPLLKDVSRLDAADEDNATRVALKIQGQLARAEYEQATNTWSDLEDLITSASNNVDFYNFLLDSESDTESAVRVSLHNISSGSPGHYSQYLSSKMNSRGSESPFDFGAFMNGVIREKLKIIPKSVQWNGEGDIVFRNLQNDFMKSTIYQVGALLSRGVRVTIYNGQVDLICATKGTEAWVQKLKWSGLRKFNARKRTPLYCGGDITKGFVKSYNNLQFFWILGAGHFVPVDQPCLVLKMLDRITNQTATRQ